METLSSNGARDLDIVACTTFVGNFIQIDKSGHSSGCITTYASGQSDELDSDTTSALANATGALPCAAYLTGNFSQVLATTEELCSLGSWYLQMFHASDKHVSLSEAAWLGVLPWAGDNLGVVEPAASSESLLPDKLTAALEMLPQIRWEPMKPQQEQAKTPYIVPCLGDGAAAALGSAALGKALLPTLHTHRPIVSVSIGTSAAVRCIVPLTAHSKERIASHLRVLVQGHGGWVYRITPDAVLCGAAITDGAAVLHDIQATVQEALQWIAHDFSMHDTAGTAQAAIRRCMNSMAAGKHLSPAPSSVLPLMGGERAPGMRGAGAAGVASGITRTSGLSESILSRVQGVCCQLSLLLGCVLPLVGVSSPSDCVVIGSGGALESGLLWRRVLANTLHAPVYVAGSAPVPAAPDAAGTGTGAAAAAQADVGTNGLSQLETTSLGLLVHALWEYRRVQGRTDASTDASTDVSAFAACAAPLGAKGQAADEFTPWAKELLQGFPPMQCIQPDENAQEWKQAVGRYQRLYLAAESSGILPPRVSFGSSAPPSSGP